MRFRTFQGARAGINDVVRALSAPGGGAYNDTMRDLAYVDSAQAGARRDDSETSLNQQKFDARNSIAGALQGVPLPPGLSPDVVSSLFVGSENPNFRDYTQGMVDMGGTQAQGLALDAAQRGDTAAMNRFNTVTKTGETYEPFAMTEAGVVDQGTGAYSVSDLARAREGQANAAAANSMAGARANDALAAQRGFMEVSPGATVYGVPGNPILDALPRDAAAPDAAAGGPASPLDSSLDALVTAPPTPSQQGGAAGKPTESSRKYSELVALGVPPETARGTAYGTIRQVTDARGNVVLVDVASTNVLGTLKTDPRTGQTAWQPSQAPPPAAPGGIAQPTTQAEYDALPSGAIFIDPDDGQQYRKP